MSKLGSFSILFATAVWVFVFQKSKKRTFFKGVPLPGFEPDCDNTNELCHGPFPIPREKQNLKIPSHYLDFSSGSFFKNTLYNGISN